MLAALLGGESSGYDLAKSFDASVANFWTATPQQLYRELDRLAADGLIEARVVQQERRPTKRIFSLTPAGHAAIMAFTAAPPKPSTFRNELLIKVNALDGGDPAAVRDLVADQLRWSTDKLERYERMRLRLLGGRDEDDFLATGERIGPYLTLLRGIAFEEENIRWGTRTLSVLDKRLGSEPIHLA